MTLEETLTWPFFDERHRRFAEALARFADTTLAELPHDDVDAACRARVKALGEAGFLKAVMPAEHGGLYDRLDVRTLCLAREILAFRDGLSDFAFAMQGLGSASISLFGSAALKARYLPPVRDGRAIAAFALSEPEAGSDVAALAATAKPDGASHLRIDGSKTWISNGGIADHYVVFARTGEGPGAKGLSAFVVDADAPGLSVAERIEVIAPHPLAALRFEGQGVRLDSLEIRNGASRRTHFAGGAATAHVRLSQAPPAARFDGLPRAERPRQPLQRDGAPPGGRRPHRASASGA